MVEYTKEFIEKVMDRVIEIHPHGSEHDWIVPLTLGILNEFLPEELPCYKCGGMLIKEQNGEIGRSQYRCQNEDCGLYADSEYVEAMACYKEGWNE